MCGPTVPSEVDAFGKRVIATAPSNNGTIRKHASLEQPISATTAVAVDATAVNNNVSSSYQNGRRRRNTFAGLRLFEFHGSLGMTSFAISVLLWGLWDEASSRTNLVHVLLVVLSVVSSTVLSIHSSWKMLDQVPIQTVIWVCSKDKATFQSDTSNVHRMIPFSHITAPHREAFQRTSLILQYVNARILQTLSDKDEEFHGFGIAAWILVGLTCLRMIPWPTSLDWKNGNTFCFVVPMVGSVIGDFVMVCYCARKTSNIHSQSWLSMKELVFVQLAGLVIAFLFTLGFRSKHNRAKSRGQLIRGWSIQIRPLYFVTSVGVNMMVIFGFVKAALLLLVHLYEKK
ncbi:hypothetical protein IV203_007508 [Nitzschia inconspicua]|uniref:Transmembrane protein n=1 Tax=Nitzschia inconspicua TaxID=303405 RepID=A0A9K3PD08_9STRA|nr:hypothetical protein IV203_007508 [Nitzschia inconspicua]